MNRTPWKSPPEPVAAAEKPVDVYSAITRERHVDAIWMGSFTSPRSTQITIGASEIGGPCDRQIGYRAAGTPAVNHPDPGRTLAGTGMHEALAAIFRRIDGGSGRYLVEHSVSYRDIPGTVDLHDRKRRLVTDWKTTTKRRLSQIRKEGPPRKYIIQAHIYAAGLREEGESVDNVAIAYLPVDGELDDMWLWSTPVDLDVANEAIDRFEAIEKQAAIDGPESLTPYPTRLCPWCAHYRAGATNPAMACPGNKPKTAMGSG